MRRVERQPKPCEHCGKIMQVMPYAMRRKRFCSRSCLGKAENVTHLKPGTKPNLTSFRAGEHIGRAHPHWVQPISFVCEYCAMTFYKKPWQTRNPYFSGRFCSAQCRGRYRAECASGENAPDWVGGPKTYRGRGWQLARTVVVSDQNGVCADCGKYVGRGLPVHHIRPFREFSSPAEANARDNLIGLCQSCHMLREPRPVIGSPRRRQQTKA